MCSLLFSYTRVHFFFVSRCLFERSRRGPTHQQQMWRCNENHFCKCAVLIHPWLPSQSLAFNHDSAARMSVKDGQIQTSQGMKLCAVKLDNSGILNWWALVLQHHGKLLDCIVLSGRVDLNPVVCLTKLQKSVTLGIYIIILYILFLYILSYIQYILYIYI